MTYPQTTWADYASPALSAANLNKIEQGIADAWGPEIGVQTDHGAVGDGATNDAAAIQAAINQAFTLQGTVVFEDSSGGYLYNTTLDFKANRYIGLGNSAILRRGGNFVGITMEGNPVNVSTSGRYQQAYVHNLYFRGGVDENSTNTADHMRVGGASFVVFDNCEWKFGAGRHILMREVWDSRLNNCRFLYGGTANGSVPAMEIQSETAIPGDSLGRFYEISNQIYMTGVHFENYKSRALDIVGTKTNEMVINGKFESAYPNQSHIRMNNSIGINFQDITITSQGINNTATAIPALVEFTGECTSIFGTIHAEHMPGGSSLTNFINLNDAWDVDLVFNNMRGNDTATTATAYVISSTNENFVNIRGSLPVSTRNLYSAPAAQKHRGIKILSNSGGSSGGTIRSGSGTPEGSVSGSIGDIWLRTDGSTSTTLYVKTSGTATNTGWTAK